MTKQINNKTGFIALMSAVIISAIMIGFLFTTNKASFYARFDALDAEFKRVASNLSESCMNQALLKLAQDYSYDPAIDPAYITGKGVPVNVGSDLCYIVSTVPGGPRAGSSANVTIKTQGIYKNTFSSFQTKVTVSNPNVASFVPLPSCYIWVNTNSISSGQNVTIGWNSSNATNMKIIAVNNHTYDINPAIPVSGGSQVVTPSTSETFVGMVTNSVGTTQCTTPTGFLVPSIIVQPPPTCADTVMMLDRTGSMSSTDRTNEGNAAKSLVTLYQNAVPQGQVGVGSFGAYPNQSLPAGSASISTSGQLGFNFTTLTNLINSMMGSSSSVGTNLADAVGVSDTELGSIRHDSTKAKVLILVSDGEPNEPSGSTIYNTGFESPTGTVAPSQWTDPLGAFTSNDSYATDSTNGHQQIFSGFNFNIPASATITGVQVNTEAKMSALPPLQTGILFPNGQGNYASWIGDESDIDETGTISCGTGDGNENISTDDTGDRESVNLNLSSIPNGSTITSVNVSVSYTDDTSSGSDGTFKTFARVGGVNTDASTNLAASGSSSSVCNHLDTQIINIPDVVKSSSTDLEVGVLKTATDTSSVWVGAIRAVVTYTPPNSGSVSTSLSSNNGGSFTSAKNTVLTTTESVSSPSGNSPTDMWDRAWTPSNFNNGNFAFRIQNNLVTGTTVFLDEVQVRVNYIISTNPNTAATSAANNAKANGVDIFTIHFGSTSGRNFLASLASGASDNDVGNSTTQASRDLENGDGDNFYISPGSSDMLNIFSNIGVKVCPAAVSPPIPPIPPTPPIPPPPPPNITISSWEEI